MNSRVVSKNKTYLNWDWDLLVDVNWNLDSVWTLNCVGDINLIRAWYSNWYLNVIGDSLSVNNWDLNNWSWSDAGVASIEGFKK
jgi:hypothetical protein